MDTIKNLALTFIAIVVGLMLLMTPEPQQKESPDRVPALVNQGQTIKFEQDQPVLIERYQITKMDVIATPEQTVDSPPALYPELEQIALTENLPATEALLDLQSMLSNLDPVIRLAAIESLGGMTSQYNLPTLSAALNDPVPQLRIAALEALALQENASVVSSIEPYLFDQDREVKVAAINALADLEFEAAVHSLAGLLTDQDSLIRRHTVYALGEIGGEYAMMYLLQARNDPDATIRTNAEAILAELEYKAAY
ncbi:MAG: HEAT repeat domain-containing protein [Proteobacteria bacterium]|nr:HEAT repeat domain-containing protein [Pseudomonadota bacterium]